jgi:hypothetical protein
VRVGQFAYSGVYQRNKRGANATEFGYQRNGGFKNHAS